MWSLRSSLLPLFSALLGFCPICRLPLQFVFFKLHHPRFFASFLLPAFVNSSQRGRSLGLAFEASRIVLLIILGNNPSFSFLLERACTPPPRALRLSSQANKRKFCSVLIPHPPFLQAPWWPHSSLSPEITAPASQLRTPSLPNLAPPPPRPFPRLFSPSSVKAQG